MRRLRSLRRWSIPIVLLTAVAPGAAEAWTVPADAVGDRGDQHVEYPSFSSEVYGAPSMAVGTVGDVNGDGMEDIGVGFGSGQPSFPESVFVTFSARDGGAGEALGFGGFRIMTESFWYGIAGAGDVNADGLDDVAVVEHGQTHVVFGKADGAAVETADLGARGFTIEGVGTSSAIGFGSVMVNDVVDGLGDVNGDGRDDLLVASGGSAAIVYPPPLVAGQTIDARAPGPFVSRLTTSGAAALDKAHVDDLGDIDGDGRHDVLIGGEETDGVDQVAYGVIAPPPGSEVDLSLVAATGRGFELRTHDGTPQYHGELEGALSLGDQNGDGRREVAMVGHDEWRRQMRVVYSPEPGTTLDVDDLRSDERGYRMWTYSAVVDAGDQNGDGRGDHATSNYVYFSEPEAETGEREPVHSGFYFTFENLHGAVVAPLDDVNGDGRPELVVARPQVQRLNEAGGERATYAIDVFDSAHAPEVPEPELPVDAGGILEVPIDIASGAGSRGGGTVGIEPTLELATADGRAVASREGSVVPSGGPTTHVSLGVPTADARLTPGATYRARYVVGNNRGLTTAGPWRSFTYRPGAFGPGPPGGTPGFPSAGRVELLSSRLRARRGFVRLRLRCAGTAVCRGGVRLTMRRRRTGTRRKVAARSVTLLAGRTTRVRVRLRRSGRAALRARRKVVVRVRLRFDGVTTSSRVSMSRR